MSANVILYI